MSACGFPRRWTRGRISSWRRWWGSDRERLSWHRQATWAPACRSPVRLHRKPTTWRRPARRDHTRRTTTCRAAWWRRPTGSESRTRSACIPPAASTRRFRSCARRCRSRRRWRRTSSRRKPRSARETRAGRNTSPSTAAPSCVAASAPTSGSLCWRTSAGTSAWRRATVRRARRVCPAVGGRTGCTPSYCPALAAARRMTWVPLWPSCAGAACPGAPSRPPSPAGSPAHKRGTIITNLSLRSPWKYSHLTIKTTLGQRQIDYTKRKYRKSVSDSSDLIM